MFQDMSISNYFFELVSLTKAFLEPRAKNSIIFSQGYLLSEPSMVYEGSRVKTFGSLFFYRYTLARSNIKNSIHIRVF